MELERMHVMALRELTDDAERLLFVMVWRSAEVLNNWRQENITLVFKKWQDNKPGYLQASKPFLAPGKNMA